MTAQPKRQTTEQEYVAFERASTTKHEYFAGEVFVMAGGALRHNIIATKCVVNPSFLMRHKMSSSILPLLLTPGVRQHTEPERGQGLSYESAACKLQQPEELLY
jgi:hypothetical protein